MSPNPRDESWRELVAGLSGAAAGAGLASDPATSTGGRATERRLGLQFELRQRAAQRPGQWQGRRDEAARHAERVDRLGVRPVARGRRGAWVKDGLNWQNIVYQGSSAGIDPAQARWFAQFAMLKGTTPGVYGAHGAEWLTLDEFESPLLWGLFDEAARLGIALTGGDVTPTVRIGRRAWLGLDATRETDAAADATARIRLEPRLAIDDLPRSLERVRLIGTHGVAAFDLDSGVIELAPLAEPLSVEQRGLLAHPRGIVVPAADEGEFFERHFFPLSRRVPVASLDGSFTPPSPRPSELVLALRFGRGDVVRIAWSWHDADGESRPVAASDSTEATGGGAPPARERELSIIDEVCERLGLEHLTAAELRGVDAAVFVAEQIPRLEGLEGVRVVETGGRPDYREVDAVPELRVTTVESPKTDWFDLGVMVTVDGRVIPFMPLFRALAKGQKRLLLVDKSYLKLTQPIFEPLRELIEEAGTLAEWEAGLRIHRSRTSLWSDFEDLAHESAPAVAWRATVAGLEHGAVEALPQPAGVALPLREYQLTGFRWLAFLHRCGLGGILADDMGLGKTAQVLALIAHVAAQSPTLPVQAAEPSAQRRPFLVVAPTSVISNWAREAARFTPGLRVASVSATERASGRRIADAAAGADLVITSYALLRLEADAFAALDWGGLVLDEAQFVKNADTRVHAAAAAIRAETRLAVTGTPIENSLADLWAILSLVAPGLFPSRRAFDEQYRRPIEHDQNAERRERLQRRIRPLLLRRTKEAVAPELPEKQEQVLTVALHPEHRRLYDTVLQRERQKLLGLLDDDLDRSRFIVYRSITLLRLLALDASLVDAEQHHGIGSAKLDALFEQLDEVLAEGHRALVFSQFTGFLGRVAERLDAAGTPYSLLDGSTPMRKRDEAIERFRSGAASVFLISLKAGGFGLNLTEADYVFLLDPWWNPASEAQAIDRAHRIGQTERVMVYRLVAEGTIEEKVMALKEKKGALVASVLDELGESPAIRAESKLSVADLRELLEP